MTGKSKLKKFVVWLYAYKKRGGVKSRLHKVTIWSTEENLPGDAIARAKAMFSKRKFKDHDYEQD